MRKLLAMKIEVTTAEILAVCQMHLAIAANVSSMGLATKTISTVQKSVKKQVIHGSPYSNCMKCHTLGREHCPGKDSTCQACQKVARSVGRLTRPRMSTRKLPHNLIINLKEEKG